MGWNERRILSTVPVGWMWFTNGQGFQGMRQALTSQTRAERVLAGRETNYAATMWFLTAYLTSSALLLAPSTSMMRYL